MCGISGFYGSFESSLLDEMNISQAHRGPDSFGCWHDSKYQIGLAHRRLSIRDTSPAGNQPFFSRCNNVSIVYNGEIYNTDELFNELVLDGYTFVSSSDTEIILNLYLKYGYEILNKLNGIFAFAIWDKRNNELFLARDGMGVKPLYYCETFKGFIFASEIKALLKEKTINREINPMALASQITYLWSPAPNTIFKKVSKLMPGYALVVRQGKTLKKWKFFSQFYQEEDSTMTFQDAKFQLRNYIKQAVERQMVSDVPVGTFLSGGLDSSAITAFARNMTENQKLKCFTISINDKSAKKEGITSDLPYAKKVADHLGVDLFTVNVGPEMSDELNTMIYHLDEPQADPASLNVLLISRLAKQHGIKVLLSGSGGDDIFSGYRRHRALMLEKYWSFFPLIFRKFISKSARKLPYKSPFLRRINKAFRYADLSGDSRLASYFKWLDTSTVNNLFSADLQNELSNFSHLEDSLTDLPKNIPDLNRMLYLEQKHYLADHNLNYTDKMSMAEGVEVRVPLLDLDLVKLAANLPINFKQNGKEGKWIFKKAMEGILPNEVIYRPKTGFGVPLRSWVHGSLKDQIRDVLSESSIKKRNWFDQKSVLNLIKEDEDGKIDATYSIFALLCIELWARIFLD